jgi:GNAT superfamily N-acetyltransferase
MLLASPLVLHADLFDDSHANAVLELMQAYAADPMGAGAPLPADVAARLIPGLRQHRTAHVLLALLDERPVGIATCFLGFSTFAAMPLLNISDYYVAPSARGTGVGRALMSATEVLAVELGCCKLTLEVQERNFRARKLYEEFGFKQSVHVPEAGGAIFLTKPLSTSGSSRDLPPK